MLYHYRIVKNKVSNLKRVKINRIHHDNYIKYWQGSKAIDKYILDRKRAGYSLLLFLEYIPITLNKWILDNSTKIYTFNKKMCRTLSFLKKQNILHFDVHYGNILTDGKEFYLTDFGLALDKGFELSEKEKSFFNKHINYDYMELIGVSTHVLEQLWQNLSLKDKSKISQLTEVNLDENYHLRSLLLLDYLDLFQQIVEIDLKYSKFIKQHQPIIELNHRFFNKIRQDKRYKYPSTEVNKRLKQLGLV